MIHTDIIVVTYNRLEKLKKALLHYEQQTSAFRNLIIVNNCSTDGTSEFLKEYCSQNHDKFQTVLINTDENLGGSGGFYLGQKKALELNADWVMVADDDAYAAPDMVEQFYNFIEHHDSSRISAVCAVVHNIDGSICDYHRRRVTLTSTKGKGLLNKISLDYNSTPVDISEYEKEYFPDKYIVTGHTPTGFIDKAYKGRIYRKNNHIAIDCGAVFGNPLGCICLDTFEEFYTE